MRIGTWTVYVERWKLVFVPPYTPDPGIDMVKFGDFPNPLVDMYKHYSAEDVKRWQEEIRGHTEGL